MFNKGKFDRTKRHKNDKESSLEKDTDSGCETNSPTSSLNQESIKLNVMDCVQKMGKPELKIKSYYKMNSIENIKIGIIDTF